MMRNLKNDIFTGKKTLLSHNIILFKKSVNLKGLSKTIKDHLS